MSDRIANYATSTNLLSYLNISQTRMLDMQYRVSTQKISPDYQGIARNAQYLTNLENSLDHLNGYMKNNDLMDLRLSITNLALGGTTEGGGIETTVKNFLSQLKTFKGLTGKTQDSIATIQQQAYNALLALEGDLNVTSGGRFLFGGGRVNDTPVDLGLTNLTDFQTKYNGSTTTYPTTRTAHIENFDISKDSSGTTNWLTFTQDGDGVTTTAGNGRITATSAQFLNVEVGTTIEVTGTANNNGTYTVKTVDGAGMYIEVETRMLTDELNNAAATITLPDGSTLDATNFTDLTFNRAGNSIVSATATALTSLTVGSSFTISGTAQNDGTYTVATNTSGTTLTIVENKLTDEGTAATPTLDLNLTAQTFSTANNTISAAAGTYSSLSAGMIIDITGAAVGNNQSYTITNVSSDGSTLTVSQTIATDETVASNADVTEADGTISSVRYYGGDQLAQTHRVDEFRSFDFDINGLDPAFEKAIRAMSIIAQGAYGTEGGLDQNLTRLDDAIYLLQSAFDGSTTGTAPYGTELTSNIRSLITTNAYQVVLIEQTTKTHTTYKGYLEGQISSIEDSDPLETIVALQDEQNALEASYMSLARIRELSLVKFM
ncbi:MAG: hypothetical protein OQK24_09900 [Magnetovibrio sp.]|nr:hypothetical protein [Magnetovibrio sp.]